MPRTETIEIRFLDRASVLVQTEVTEAGIVSYPHPMALLGGERGIWAPLKTSVSPAVLHRWVVCPAWFEPLLVVE